MKGKSLGWLILVGALAVPAVLFFKWWTQMKATQGAESRQAVPASAPFAGGSQAPAQEPAPAASEPAAAAPAAPAEPVPAKAPETASAPAPAVAPEPVAQAAPASGPAAPEEPAPAEEPPSGGTMVAKIEYMPKSSRDPMLSVSDQRELLKQKMAAQISQQELQKAAEEPVQAPAPPPKPLCDSFNLQGIIGTGGDVAAIVNDNIVREGDRVAGAVIERLTTRTVVFRKGKKTCMKRVSK